MESPIKGRTVLDIRETAKVNSKIVHNLLPAHALSGCDTVATYFGVGKGKVIKVLRAGKTSLAALGVITSNLEDVYKQATAFVSACYGTKDVATIRDAYTDMGCQKWQRCHVISKTVFASADNRGIP